MKFFKYWIVDDKNEKAEKNYVLAKLVYILFIVYFIILGLIGFFRGESLISMLIPLSISITMSLLLICDILIYYNKKNTFLLKCHTFFQRILNGIKRDILESKSRTKVPFRVALWKLLYMIIFIMIPLGFMLFTISGHWQYSMQGVSSSGVIGEREGFHQEIVEGRVKTIPLIEGDYFAQLSLFLGDIFNLQIIDICFVNNGTEYIEDIINTTFKSSVTIDNQTYDIAFKGEFCIPVSIEKQEIGYKWVTNYQYSFEDRKIINKTLDISTKANNFIKSRVNNKFWYMLILVFIGWLAICHLIYGVIKDYINIK